MRQPCSTPKQTRITEASGRADVSSSITHRLCRPVPTVIATVINYVLGLGTCALLLAMVGCAGAAHQPDSAAPPPPALNPTALTNDAPRTEAPRTEAPRNEAPSATTNGTASSAPGAPSDDWFCTAGKHTAGWNCIESTAPKVTTSALAVATVQHTANPEHTVTASSADRLNTAAPRAPAPKQGSTASITIPGYSPYDDPTRTKPRLRVLEQSPDAWVIQLIATSSRDALEQIAARNNLYDHPAVRLAAGTAVRYALIWDVYPDRAHAIAALAALPKALRDMRPWVRQVGPLQQAMNDAANITPQATSGIPGKPASKTSARASPRKTSRLP